MTKKLLTPEQRTNGLLQLKQSRNAENALDLYFSGQIFWEDLTDDEKIMYDRYVYMMAKIKSNSAEKFDSSAIIQEHCRRWGISEATARRDLRYCNNRRRELRAAEIEFHTDFLYEQTLAAIELAKADAFPAAAASAIAKNVAIAMKLLGIDSKGSGDTTFDYSRIEQHVNIIVGDEMSEKILKEMFEQNVGVFKHTKSLEEILAIEKDSIEKLKSIEKATIDKEANDAE